MRNLALTDLIAEDLASMLSENKRCSWNTKAGLNGGDRGAVLVCEHAWRVGSHGRFVRRR
jgi:hypothetical protein